MEPRSQQERNDSHSLRDCLSKELEKGKKIEDYHTHWVILQCRIKLSFPWNDATSRSQSQQTWQVLLDFIAICCKLLVRDRRYMCDFAHETLGDMLAVLRWWNLICLCLQLSGEAAMSLVCSCAVFIWFYFASNIEMRWTWQLCMCMVE